MTVLRTIAFAAAFAFAGAAAAPAMTVADLANGKIYAKCWRPPRAAPRRIISITTR
jgi:hypothetical protein